MSLDLIFQRQKADELFTHGQRYWGWFSQNLFIVRRFYDMLKCNYLQFIGCKGFFDKYFRFIQRVVIDLFNSPCISVHHLQVQIYDW